eukprot:TRINITY_DN48989_c0_g1_i1.p1 TRINITY_DN48989_c0_g1~~TRINITY_DN48989_c0_g1_i1.p1  ORF type:complete len:259 (-),score=34.26 TRINITY_DN48989_c0_g1_i1:43-819(-)
MAVRVCGVRLARRTSVLCTALARVREGRNRFRCRPCIWAIAARAMLGALLRTDALVSAFEQTSHGQHTSYVSQNIFGHSVERCYVDDHGTNRSCTFENTSPISLHTICARPSIDAGEKDRPSCIGIWRFSTYLREVPVTSSMAENVPLICKAIPAKLLTSSFSFLHFLSGGIRPLVSHVCWVCERQEHDERSRLQLKKYCAALRDSVSVDALARKPNGFVAPRRRMSNDVQDEEPCGNDCGGISTGVSSSGKVSGVIV